MTKMTKSYIQRTEDMCYKYTNLRYAGNREGVDSENADAHDCHKTIQKRNAQNNDNPSKSIDGELAEQDHDAGDLIYSFGPMHLLHIDVGKIKKRRLSRESANGESKLNLEHFVLLFLYK